MPALDFTSALYLGLWHEARSLRPWPQLTTGRPAALDEPESSQAVGRRLARLQGCERAVMGASTLHLFWDLFGLLARERIMIFLDAGAYPIARWGVERAAGRGAPIRGFAHGDPSALARRLRCERGRRPVVVADGLCAAGGCGLPLADYLDLTRRAGGLLVVDDTQALGILGRRATDDAPYGSGGGGSLAHLGLGGPDVLLISSLAKGFGAPLAALSGSAERVRWFEAESETRVHCSPPSAAAVGAAARALRLNDAEGDARRARLSGNVDHFRRRLADAGFRATGGLFPAQTVALPPGVAARGVYRGLVARGVRVVLRRDGRGRPALTFLITARHARAELDEAIGALAAAVVETRLPRRLPPPLYAERIES